VRLEEVAYMAWAKTHLEEPGIRNLGSSGIRDLLTMDDLGDLMRGLSVWGHNEDGLPELREAIAARYGVAASSVLAAEGTSLANFLVLAAWVRPGDPVLLEEPFYEPLGAALGAVGARVERVPVDGPEGHTRLLDRLKSGGRVRWRAAVATHPHNPTGEPICEDLLDALAEACASQGGLLMVDEAYREILFEDPPACAARGRPAVVSTASLTKVYGLSHLRIGWAIGPSDLIARAIRIHDNLGVVHPFLTEAIGARILRDSRRMEDWRARIRSRVEANRSALGSLLEDRPELQGCLPPGGILAFPRWGGHPHLPDADSLCERLRREVKVVLVPGRFFQRPDHVRIAVGGPEGEVREALAALGRFLAEQGGSLPPERRRG